MESTKHNFSYSRSSKEAFQRRILSTDVMLPNIIKTPLTPNRLPRRMLKFKEADSLRFYEDNSLQKKSKIQEKLRNIINAEETLVEKLEKVHLNRTMIENMHIEQQNNAKFIISFRKRQLIIENKAAAVIQKRVRGILVRKIYDKILLEKNVQKLRIKLVIVDHDLKQFYLNLGKEKLTQIIYIQRRIKYLFIRKHKRKEKMKNDAASKIQRLLRAHFNRKRFKNALAELKRKEYARKRRSTKRTKPIFQKVLEDQLIQTKQQQAEENKQPGNLVVPEEHKMTETFVTSDLESVSSDESIISIALPPQIPLKTIILPIPKRKLQLTYLKPTQAFLNKKDIPYSPPESSRNKRASKNNFLRTTISHDIYSAQTHRYTSSSPV